MTKQKLDAELKSLRVGVAEAELIGDAEAFDVADSFLAESGIKEAITKFYPNIKDQLGFVANFIA